MRWLPLVLCSLTSSFHRRSDIDYPPLQVTKSTPTPNTVVDVAPATKVSSAPRPHAHADAFRGDIEGLRGVCVASVLLFHLDITWLRSGFMGVDAFFTISGFVVWLIG